MALPPIVTVGAEVYPVPPLVTSIYFKLEESKTNSAAACTLLDNRTPSASLAVGSDITIDGGLE